MNNEADELKPVAGNGLLDRRLFLKHSMLFLTAGFAGSTVGAKQVQQSKSQEDFDRVRPHWMNTPGSEFSYYGRPSPHEEQVVRFPSPNRVMRNNGASWTPLHRLEGTLIPNGLHYERHHNGVPDIAPEQHELLIHGLVERNLKFKVDDLLRYPMQSKICFIECGGNSNSGWNTQPSQAEVGYLHGLVSNAEWTGIPLSILLKESKLKPEAKWLIAEGADAFAMNISIPLEKVMHDGLLALYQNGERLRPENGYPMRLLMPGWEGVTHVKWVRRLTITNQPAMTRNETARYTELRPDGKANRFSFIMQAKSFILSPSAGMTLQQKGYYQITGLAWSGNGKIKSVDVSADGGQTWAAAELQKPILDRAFTRFRIPWQWNGQAAVLKSKATDETGYIQPERKQLIANKGRHGFFHYNGIVIYSVDEQGSITHIFEKDKQLNQADDLSIDSGWD